MQYLFIGGAMDGMRLEVPSGYTVLHIPIKADVPIVDASGAVSQQSFPLRDTTYTLRRFEFWKRKSIEFYADESLGDDEVTNLLLKGYKNEQ